jgi:alkanesulfonate monooxygenase SsuD/methylene tetrahydromethanopterin reductase-like flavin-dependent oxidoreductase (luciferase family)
MNSHAMVDPDVTARLAMLAEELRTDEYLDAMAQLWNSDSPAYHGQFVSFADIDAHPRPVQPGGPPIVVGGRSRVTYRRTPRRGHGFYSTGTPENLTRDLAGLRRAAYEVQRPSHLGRLEITVMPIGPVEFVAGKRYWGSSLFSVGYSA